MSGALVGENRSLVNRYVRGNEKSMQGMDSMPEKWKYFSLGVLFLGGVHICPSEEIAQLLRTRKRAESAAPLQFLALQIGACDLHQSCSSGGAQRRSSSMHSAEAAQPIEVIECERKT